MDTPYFINPHPEIIKTGIVIPADSGKIISVIEPKKWVMGHTA